MNIQSVLAIGALGLIAILTLLLFFKPIPTDNAQTLGIVIGYVSGYASAVFQFYFGSSKGSESKNDAITALAGKVTGTGTGGTTTIINQPNQEEHTNETH